MDDANRSSRQDDNERTSSDRASSAVDQEDPFPTSSGRTIDQYAWKRRPVLIFAPGEGDPDLFRQRTALSGLGQGVAERDIVLIEVIGDYVRTVVGPRYTAPAETLRDTFDIDEGQFQVLLIGKDTGVKLRSDKPVPAENLFSLIDSMPMRMQEMRARA